MKAGWRVTVTKRDLVEAIGHARTRATLRRKGTGFEADIMLTGGPGQLSVRSSHAAMDIPAEGTWASPIVANGPSLRRLAPKLKGPEVTLTYVTGRLFLNGTSIPAREV
jgi:hypothetical protein